MEQKRVTKARLAECAIRSFKRRRNTIKARSLRSLILANWCREGESNPHALLRASDFKSDASANSAIPAEWEASELSLRLAAFFGLPFV